MGRHCGPFCEWAGHQTLILIISVRGAVWYPRNKGYEQKKPAKSYGAKQVENVLRN
jgi:hypothetical protein